MWKFFEKLGKLFAVAKGLRVAAFRHGIHPFNFAHKLCLKGGNKFRFGSRNRFFDATFDASNPGTSRIEIGSRNLFEEQVLVAGSGGDIFIGSETIISRNSVINGHKGSVRMGNGVFLGPNSIVQGFGGVEIGDGTMIAANTFISSSNHDFSDPRSSAYLEDEIGDKVSIGKKVWIGAGVVITAGVRIGDYAVIGAGSVVTRDVDDYCIAVGNPAKTVKRFNHGSSSWERV